MCSEFNTLELITRLITTLANFRWIMLCGANFFKAQNIMIIDKFFCKKYRKVCHHNKSMSVRCMNQIDLNKYMYIIDGSY